MNTLRSALKLMGSTDLAIDNMFARAHSKSQSHTTTSSGVGIGSFFEVRNKYVCLHCGRRQQRSDPLCARCAAADISDAQQRHAAHEAHEQPKPWPAPGQQAFLARQVAALCRCQRDKARAERQLWALGVAMARRNRLASQVSAPYPNRH